MNQTQTKNTQQAYLRRGNQLLKRAEMAYGQPLQLKPTLLIAWLETLLPTLRPTTRRQYIASCKAILIDYSKSHSDIYTDAVSKINTMQSWHYNVYPKLKQKSLTSNQKLKRVTQAEISLIYKQSANLNWKWLAPALLWMSANILVGLRPSEWRNAKLTTQNGLLLLQVKNAKTTNGRSHGPTRHLDISKLSSKEIKLINAQLNFVKMHVTNDISWEKYYNGVRHTIKRLTRKYSPKNKKYPSLYSTRHQFAANAKASGLQKIEIAALMGHAVDETATMHYGKRKNGSSSCPVTATLVEMQRIKIKDLNSSAVQSSRLN